MTALRCIFTHAKIWNLTLVEWVVLIDREEARAMNSGSF